MDKTALGASRAAWWTPAQGRVDDKFKWLWVLALFPDQLHQPPLDRGEHRTELVPALEDHADFVDQRPHALAIAQRRALLDAVLGALGGAAEGGEHGGVIVELDRIILPMPRGDHAAVEIEDPRQLETLRKRLDAMIEAGEAGRGKTGRRDRA